jgi:hypothetical protein
VSSDGTGKFTESELQYGFLSGSNHGGGKVEWDLWGKVSQKSTDRSNPTPGKLSGEIELDVEFDNGTEIKFQSRCVAEVQSTWEGEDGYTKDGGIELEAEGIVKGFPADPRGGNAAASSSTSGQDAVVTARILPSGKVAFAVELGKTCFEGYPFSETEIGFNTEDTKLDSDAPPRDSGRWGFPNGNGPGNCPGAA